VRTEPGNLLEEGVDPELLALPAPSQVRKWALTSFMALSTAAAIGLLLMFRADLAFSMAPAEVVDLGAARDLASADVASNRVARVSGTPMMSNTVYFTRLFGNARYAIFPLGGQRSLYVQVELPEGQDVSALAHTAFEGRVVRLSELSGRLGDVPTYMSRQLSLPVDGDSLVLIADERPSSVVWVWLLAAFVLVVIGTNVTMLLRWHRPITD
jgi:hypothetical protein